MTLLFWLSALLIAYVYVGYPVLLAVWVMKWRRPIKRNARRVHPLPGVSIVIAARNEAPRLPERITNLLELDYPEDRRQIIVVCDGSTDGTLEAVAPFRPAVDLVCVQSCGKALALNAGVARARHPILVFADARQTFAPDALLALVAPFTDPSIGGVSGELVLDCETQAATTSTVAEGVGLYWKYEKTLRRLESAIGSTLGATGAIYALRKSLWRPLPPDTMLDDVLAPMRAVLRGARVVFDERAKAFDRIAPDADAESRRKIRTLAGNVQILWLEPRLLLPWANPVWLQYVSHKLGRLLVPYALLGLLAANIALAGESAFYLVTLIAQCAFYLLAGYGACLEWWRSSVTMSTGKGVVNA
jgi:poly-beta-1,6-N-acetyl-D-glucosamine synthase